MKKSVQWLRQRFRDSLRAEVAQTVATPDHFSAVHYSVWETVGAATITVLRGDDLNSAVTVDYATSEGRRRREWIIPRW